MALYGYFNGFVLLTPQLDMRVHALKLCLFKILNEENKDFEYCHWNISITILFVANRRGMQDIDWLECINRNAR